MNAVYCISLDCKVSGYAQFLSVLHPRTLPAKHIGEIAEQMRKYNINALLVIGGFEVRVTFKMLLVM